MGTVYLAHREGSARRVALKVIHPGLADGDPLFRARFAREIAAARRVEGSCTARVIDGDPDAPVPWMATEFVPGDTLTARVERDGPLPVAEVIQLASGLAEALATIHRAGLIHRDLKPSNVILAADGPRVIDFGIAREVDATHLTQLGDQVGTVSYMSPEQAAGDPLTPATDVFSLGGVIHYAVTGDAPFGQGHPAVILHRIADLEPDLSPGNVHGNGARARGRPGRGSLRRWSPHAADSEVGDVLARGDERHDADRRRGSSPAPVDSAARVRWNRRQRGKPAARPRQGWSATARCRG